MLILVPSGLCTALFGINFILYHESFAQSGFRITDFAFIALNGVLMISGAGMVYLSFFSNKNGWKIICISLFAIAAIGWLYTLGLLIHIAGPER
jgi:uncharacterized membrane protein